MNEVLLIFLGVLVAFVCGVSGVATLAGVARRRRRAIAAAELQVGGDDSTLLDDVDKILARTGPGRWLAVQIDLAGISHRPSLLVGVGLAVTVVSTYVLWRFIAPVLAVIGLVAGVMAVRAYLRRAQTRRREAFVGQLPELARVLANASYAGLSLPTAVAIASDELPEPAHGELGRVATRLSLGGSLVTALEELQERVGTRETKVLISTLVVSSRSGGSLVTALRDIAETLDQRKETRREITSILSQSVASSNLVILMGFAMLLLVNGIKPGTVDEMTRNPIGQIALIAGGGLFVGGWLLIRRMTRIDA